MVLLGAGGAGAAIAHAVLRLGAKHLVVNDREGERAAALAQSLNALYGAGRVSASEDVAAALHGASGLIHATPTGMDKLPGLPLPAELLRPALWVAEVVYFPIETALLKAARERGCATVDGGGMAVWQAVGAFKLFTGLEPDAARMEAHFRRLLAARAARPERSSGGSMSRRPSVAQGQPYRSAQHGGFLMNPTPDREADRRRRPTRWGWTASSSSSSPPPSRRRWARCWR